MEIVGISDINFTDYKLPSLYIATPHCSFKCEKDCGRAICQNSPLAKCDKVFVTVDKIVELYQANPITQAFVFGGLEPLDSSDLLDTIVELQVRAKPRRVVIYTGYTEEEVHMGYSQILSLSNLVIKYGRFIPDQPTHFDPILGVNLASPNQYAKEYNITDAL